MEDTIRIDCEPELYQEDPVSLAAYENFGIKYLYPWQRLVVANILEAYEYYRQIKEFSLEEKARFESENEDSFCRGRQIVLLPTGAGKSLCFQIPALLFDGPTMVIYPLLALMTDQQRRMEEGSLGCVVFRGGQSETERQENFQKIREGAKIILANPEVLKNKTLLNQLKECGIVHVAIDEAHISTEWGDSFRPAYLDLGKVLDTLQPPVITAFTATASPEVLKRIGEILFNGEAHVVRSESDRKNIHYFVRKSTAKKKMALELALTELRPMIIFCGTRNNSEDMARELNACFGDGIARFYHAGLDKSEKDEVESWFYHSKNGILCSTCAYGMGVDKKDIKTVVHIEPPATAEAYLQEAGRGGRDGSVAKAILLWSLGDSVKYKACKSGSREAAMRDFAETTECRRQVLLDVLGAEQTVCSGCDICNERKKREDLENLKKFQRWKALRKMDKERFVADWEDAYTIVKRNPHLYTEQELEDEIAVRQNYALNKKLGFNVWTHSDSVDIVTQLKESGKVVEGNFLWKGKLQTGKEN
ncbi:MAG: RecQ family ATP-dependent DNA helicase [Treponema sp.]|nr:RecQ family ATP-dependent DNA helicase [Treponema sp.]